MRPYWLWDTDMDEAAFSALLSGQADNVRLDRDWAAIRLLDYGSYSDIRRLMALKTFMENWPRWRRRVRSASRRRGFDFLAAYLAGHPEKIRG